MWFGWKVYLDQKFYKIMVYVLKNPPKSEKKRKKILINFGEMCQNCFRKYYLQVINLV